MAPLASRAKPSQPPLGRSGFSHNQRVSNLFAAPAVQVPANDATEPGDRMQETDPQARATGEEAVDAMLAAAGDARAFERLYRRHVARIHSLSRRMAGYEEANELTQEIFVRAWSKLKTFRGESAFGTWLFRLGVNLILSHRQTRAIQRQRFQVEPDLESLPTRPAGSEVRLDVETALAQLPKGARRIFVLHDVEGYRHEEIARMLRITSGTSKAQLHRARMLMRAALTG
jgi:RNA polymerase sigma-70 factor (ECF subfamily)